MNAPLRRATVLGVCLALAGLVASASGAKDDVDLVSRASGAGPAGNADSLDPAISADGRFVSFTSRASNLDPADTDATPDVYVRDTQTGTTTLASRASDGTKGDGDSVRPTISADGRFVAFVSEADNLHPADRDRIMDVFVRDLQTATTTLVSRADGVDGEKGDGVSELSAISADGRFVAFTSFATNLHPGDSDALDDVFVRDLNTQTTTLVSRATAGDKGDRGSFDPAISADGRFVSFSSFAGNLDPGDTDAIEDVFVRDVQAGTTTLASRAAGLNGDKGDNDSFTSVISGDGRFVAFSSLAGNLDPGDGNNVRDVLVRDVRAGTTTLVSGPTGPGVKGESHARAISAGGRYVAFESLSTNLHPDDTDGESDVFVRDLKTRTNTLVSRATGAHGAKANEGSNEPAMTPDGRFVAFESLATNLHAGDDDAAIDVFRRDVLGPPPPRPPAPPPPRPPAGPRPPAPTPPSPVRDGTAPTISIIGVRGRGRSCAAHSFRVRVRIRDRSRLRYARLFLDGHRRLSTTRKRFRARIPASRLSSGRHRIRVVARDRADNRRARTVRFSRCRRGV